MLNIAIFKFRLEYHRSHIACRFEPVDPGDDSVLSILDVVLHLSAGSEPTSGGQVEREAEKLIGGWIRVFCEDDILVDADVVWAAGQILGKFELGDGGLLGWADIEVGAEESVFWVVDVGGMGPVPYRLLLKAVFTRNQSPIEIAAQKQVPVPIEVLRQAIGPGSVVTDVETAGLTAEVYNISIAKLESCDTAVHHANSESVPSAVVAGQGKLGDSKDHNAGKKKNSGTVEELSRVAFLSLHEFLRWGWVVSAMVVPLPNLRGRAERKANVLEVNRVFG